VTSTLSADVVMEKEGADRDLPPDLLRVVSRSWSFRRPPFPSAVRAFARRTEGPPPASSFPLLRARSMPTFRICWMSTLTVLLKGVCPADRGFHGSGKVPLVYNTQPLESQILIDSMDFCPSRRRSSARAPRWRSPGRVEADLFRIRSMILRLLSGRLPVEEPRLHRRHRVLPDDRAGLTISIREASRPAERGPRRRCSPGGDHAAHVVPRRGTRSRRWWPFRKSTTMAGR